jgi:hypothetical protein
MQSDQLIKACPTLSEFHRLISVGSDHFYAAVEAEMTFPSQVPKHLGSPPCPPVNELLVEAVCQELQRFVSHKSLRRKVGCLLTARSILLASGVGTDDYNTLLVYCLARANPSHFLSHFSFVQVFCPTLVSLKIFSDFCLTIKCIIQLSPPVDPAIEILHATAQAQAVAKPEPVAPAPAAAAGLTTPSVHQKVARHLLEMGYSQSDVALCFHLVPFADNTEQAVFHTALNFLTNLQSLLDDGNTRAASIEALVACNFRGVAAARMLTPFPILF